MKFKSLLILFLSFWFINMNAQEVFDAKIQATNNLEVLKQAISKELPHAALNSNQLAKLEKIFLDINKQKKELIKAGASKTEYTLKATEIENKFQANIVKVLTADQLKVYETVKAASTVSFQKQTNTSKN